ncbi:MAG: hypothetical protein IPO94_18235 [Saprospiraceae bacterium]|nr:hypothetical protein [Saprospiraceae bacterium]
MTISIFFRALLINFTVPKGAGFAFISNEHIISPYIHGGAQERNMRAGTENVAGIAGLAKALEISTANMETNYAKILDLRNKFKTGLSTTLDDISIMEIRMITLWPMC